MTTRTEAVRYAMNRIMYSTDWQEVADAMLNDGRFDNLLLDQDAAVSIVRDAENKLGNRIPADYSN